MNRLLGHISKTHGEVTFSNERMNDNNENNVGNDNNNSITEDINKSHHDNSYDLVHDSTVAAATSEQSQHNNNEIVGGGGTGTVGGGGGLLHKISKRYSTISNRIARRSNVGRKSVVAVISGRNSSPQKMIVSGSYDMSGNGVYSDDHRLEIGAPILISTTTLDADRLDVSEERLRQIGGGIAATKNATYIRSDGPLLVSCPPKACPISINPSLSSGSPQFASSSSENDSFVDAVCVTPVIDDAPIVENEVELEMKEIAIITAPIAIPDELIEDSEVFVTPQHIPSPHLAAKLDELTPKGRPNARTLPKRNDNADYAQFRVRKISSTATLDSASSQLTVREVIAPPPLPITRPPVHHAVYGTSSPPSSSTTTTTTTTVVPRYERISSQPLAPVVRTHAPQPPSNGNPYTAAAAAPPPPPPPLPPPSTPPQPPIISVQKPTPLTKLVPTMPPPTILATLATTTSICEKTKKQHPATSSNPVTQLYEALARRVKPVTHIGRKSRSKSAQNLHRSELQVILHRVPSHIELDMSMTTADLENCHDLPRLEELYSRCGDRKANINNINNDYHHHLEGDKENSVPIVVEETICGSTLPPLVLSDNRIIERNKSKSAPNTPYGPTNEHKIIDSSDHHKSSYFVNQSAANIHSKSIDSLDSERLPSHPRRSNTLAVLSNANSNSSNTLNHLPLPELPMNATTSKNSLLTVSSVSMSTVAGTEADIEEDDEFDNDDDDDDTFSNLKSVSCQSLNAQQSLFVSIDELNEITRQINESEEFNNDLDLDLEYCTHRDNLKPNERRITLLKNKNTRLINFSNNKEKLKRGWSDVKHWLGEEKTRFKEKHGTLHRLAASRLNLHSSSTPDSSPVADGGAPIETSIYESIRLGNADEHHSPKSAHMLNTSGDINGSGGGATMQSPHKLGVGNNDDDEVNLNESSFLNVIQPIREKSEQTESDEDTIRPPKADKSDGGSREGQNGFEELRRYVKQGGDFGKELIFVLQERVDSEMLYSKSLSKMANKLNKACRELPGTVAEAWRGVANEMEQRSDVHRQLSQSLTEEIVKPLKVIVDTHHKTRKSVESNVDKAARVLTEWRVSEAKAKKNSHTAARENEKLQDAMLDVRIQKSPSIALLHQSHNGGAGNGTGGGVTHNKLSVEKELKTAEKDCAKLDNKRKKAEEAVKRADVEYYTLCVRAERARVDWEMAVWRGSTLLQSIEQQRLLNLTTFVTTYGRLSATMQPILESLVHRLVPQVENCSVVKDMQVVKAIRRNADGPSEQLLPDFYCEHTTLAMNRERRKQALVKLLQLVKTDLERERRSRSGLKGLSQSLNTQEQHNITDKLYHIRSMLTYLEGARFKLHSALLELDHKPRTSHPLAQHIQITRDRTGLQQSVLKVPLWLKNNDKLGSAVANGEEHAYEIVSSPQPAVSNISCMDLSAKDALLKSFSRSKSNIETFSCNNTQIVMPSSNGNGAVTDISNSHTTTTTTTTNNNNNINKSKTLGKMADDPYSDRGQADGGSNQQDSDFDEFSSQDGDDDERDHITVPRLKEQQRVSVTTAANGSVASSYDNHYQNAADISSAATNVSAVFNSSSNSNNNHINVSNNYNSSSNINTTTNCANDSTFIVSDSNGQATLSNSPSSTTVVLGHCKALYCYTPKLYDELELTPGDIIEVHAKQDDGWWLGALRNQIGIFPATYVEELP